MSNRKSSKPRLIGADGNTVCSAVPSVKEVKPCGNLVLLEILTAQEVLGTQLSVGGNSETLGGAPQAYVIAVGPRLESENNFGFGVGDRVILSTGAAVPVPRPSDSHRDRVLVDPAAVRGVVVEDA